MKRIGIFTSARSDYGYLQPLIAKVHAHPFLDLSLFVSGTHYSSDYGHTLSDIQYPITHTSEIVLSHDTASATTKSMGLALIQYSEQIRQQPLDVMILLGDRFETLAMAIACYNSYIPIAHISGGETTEGSLDDGYRWAISQFAAIHFVYTDQYGVNVVKRTWNDNVHNIGLLPLETIPYIPRPDSPRGYVCIVHPPGQYWIQELLWALPKAEPVIFIQPNTDAGSRSIWDAIVRYCPNFDNVRLALNMDRDKFLNTLGNTRALIGNSSAGIYEAPWLGTPTINIGDRQKGRLQAKSIINCPGHEMAIRDAIDQITNLPSRSEWELPFVKRPSSDIIIDKLGEFYRKH